ncbi:MAG: hypothetical protein M3132_15195 [Actinomycetia bacterium]|nr:hypothetical protein [Actinomycetes bacterium]
MSRISTRLCLAFVAAMLVTTACTTAGSSTSEPPPLTVQDEAELTAEALVRLCTGTCSSSDLYVYDALFTGSTLAGNEKPMPAETRNAIEAAFPDAILVTMAEADALFGPDALVDGGKGALLSASSIDFLRGDVIGIEIGEVNARDGGHGSIVQFLWNGETWEPTDSSVTGVTTTSWVS